MARTFKHTNKGKKRLKGFIVSYMFDVNWNNKERKANKVKGGAIVEGNEDLFNKIISGSYTKGIPKRYRKFYNKKQKLKIDRDLSKKFREDKLDEVELANYVKNAGYYYY